MIMIELKDYCKSQNQEILLLKSALEQMNEMVIITEADLENFDPKIIYVNSSFLEITGYRKEEIIGKTPKILQGPETDRKMLQDLKRTLLNGHTFHGSTVNYKKDGTPYNVEWSIAPVKDRSGDITHWVSVQSDITAHVQTHKDLRKQNRK